MTLLFLDVDGTLLPVSGPVFTDDPNPLPAGRPFAWVDDEITAADRRWVAAHHPGHALLHRVDARRGLTDDDYDALGAWIKEI
jgi:hypothetical protein